MVDGLRVCNPQEILLRACADSFSQELEYRTPGARSTKGVIYPKWTVPTNDIPELLEKPLLYSSGFFDQDIPLVSLGFSHLVLPILAR